MFIKLILLTFFLQFFMLIDNSVNFKGNTLLNNNSYECYSNLGSNSINHIYINTYSTKYYNISIIDPINNINYLNITPDNIGYIDKTILVNPGYWNICMISFVDNISIKYYFDLYYNIYNNLTIFFILSTLFLLFFFIKDFKF